MYFGVAKFALVEPLYNFYWDNLLERAPLLLEKENKRLRFIGHACAIGPEEVNLNLSIKRAEAFYDRFVQDVKAAYPGKATDILARIDKPEGFGESRPFTFKGEGGEFILLGDNETPTGRQLNRRIITMIYTDD